jgi:hypothetical protein
MLKKTLLLGVVAGLLSGLASIIFSGVYKEAMFIDFSPIVNNVNLVSACMFGCILASIGYFGLVKITPKFGEIIFNLLFTILSFASIIGPIAHTFPPEMDSDLTMFFPGFAMTLHFFPAIVWFALKPIFIRNN